MADHSGRKARIQFKCRSMYHVKILPEVRAGRRQQYGYYPWAKFNSDWTVGVVAVEKQEIHDKPLAEVGTWMSN